MVQAGRRVSLLLLLSFVGYIALGMPDAVIGPAWPSLRAHFDLPVDALGAVLITTTTGSVIASTGTSWILRRMGIGHLLTASCLVTAASLTGYVFAPAWTVFVLMGLLSGIGAGAIDTAINTFAALRYSARVVNVLHAFYGVGAAAGPAIMTAMLVTNRGWQAGYGVIIALEVALAIAFFLTRAQWPTPQSSTEHHRDVSLLQTMRLGRVQLSMLVFFVYTGCEAAVGAWAFSLLFEARDFSTSTAGAAVTIYWIGLFASRLGYAFLPSGTNPVRVIRASIVSAFAGIVVLMLDLSPVIDIATIALIGFASGPIFPSLISTTPARVGENHTANTVGLQIAMASMGLALIPSLCGVVAARAGLESIPVVLAICWLVVLVAYLVLDRRH